MQGFHEDDSNADRQDAKSLFGKSVFAGREESLSLALERWWIQIGTLLWKNSLVLLRRRLQLLALLIIPLLLVPSLKMGMGPGGVSGGTPPPSPPVSHASPYMSHPPYSLDKLDKYNIVYAPNNIPAYVKIMESVDRTGGAIVTGFPDTLTLQHHVARSLGLIDFAIFFVDETLWQVSDTHNHQSELENIINYVVFHNATQEMKYPSQTSLDAGVTIGLLSLQKQIEHGIIKHRLGVGSVEYNAGYAKLAAFQPPSLSRRLDTGSSNNTSLDFCNMQSNDFSRVSAASCWAFSFGLLCIGVFAFQLVTEERTKGLFKTLRRIGLYDSTYWLSWFTSFQLIILPGTILAIIFASFFKLPNDDSSLVLRHMDMGILFLIIWLGASASVAHGLFLASICNRPSLHSVAIFLNFILMIITITFDSTPLDTWTNIPSNSQQSAASTTCQLVGSSYNRIYSEELLLSGVVRLITFFMPWFHISKAFLDVLSVTQYVGQSYTAADIARRAHLQLVYDATNPAAYRGYGLQASLVNLVCLTIVYLLLAWLFGQVLSSDSSGESKSLNSVFLSPLFFGSSSTTREYDDDDARGREQRMSYNDKSVRVYKCSKTYSGVQALKEVSFQVTRGECFVILGHNGSGKSSLLNILTGVTRPTHGHAYISGLDVDAGVQQSIGVCPQDDYLWDDLTAHEHMMLHARFRGLSKGPKLLTAVNHVLARVQLLRRGSTLAKNFSGGMKRRLSVSMAAVGDADVVFLDEPSTGLDPLSRRYLWDTVNWLKQSRAVILTTHNMEEADYLGDTVMLLHGGRVKALGDPLFLKHTYGTGLAVKLSTDAHNAESVLRQTKNLLPRSWPVGEWTSGTMTINVPVSDVPLLSVFFAWIEGPDCSLIREWSISDTSLEQVFMQVCVANTEINFVAPVRGSENNRDDHNLCPLCRIRQREPVILRCLDTPETTSSPTSSHLMLIPDAMCSQCTRNEAFFLTDDDWSELAAMKDEIGLANIIVEEGRVATSIPVAQQQRQHRLKTLLRDAYIKAQSRSRRQVVANSSPRSDALSPAIAYSTGSHAGFALLETGDIESSPHSHAVTVNPLASQMVSVASNAAATHGGALGPPHQMPIMSQPHMIVSGLTQSQQSLIFSPRTTLNPSFLTQTKAIMLKNITLQRHQSCSNKCILLFTVFMMLSLVFFEYLFRFRGVAPCPGGWTTAGDCSIELLSDHIFSASEIPLPGFRTNEQLKRPPKRKPAPNGKGGGNSVADVNTLTTTKYSTRYTPLRLLRRVVSSAVFRNLASDDGGDDDGADPQTDDDDSSASPSEDFSAEGSYIKWGFRIAHYLIPSAFYSPLSPTGPVLNGAQRSEKGLYLATQGLPVYTNRFPNVWTWSTKLPEKPSGVNVNESGILETLLAGVSTSGLGLKLMPAPEALRNAWTAQPPSPDSPSAVQSHYLSTQRACYEAIQTYHSAPSNAYPACQTFAPALLITNGTWATYSAEYQYQPTLPDPIGQEAWSSKYADAVFECVGFNSGKHTQTANSQSGKGNSYGISDRKLDNDDHVGFSGTLYVTQSSQGPEIYKYALLDLYTGELRPGQSSADSSGTDDRASRGLLQGDTCPSSTALLSLGRLYALTDDATVIAMTYLNLLSNSLLDSSLASVPIQGGISTFGALFFNFLVISEFISTFLTIFLALIFNALWPLSIWRLAYERSHGLTSMLKSIGLRTTSYYTGMYTFDVATQTILSAIAIAVAVYMDLSVFHDAPGGALLFTALLSAHAVTSIGLLFIQVSPSNSRLCSLLAASVSIFSTVFSVLLNIFYYRDEGQYPGLYYMIPFFAQTRAVYLLLVYHTTTHEVVLCWLGLFFTGIAAVLLTITIEANPYNILDQLKSRLHSLLLSIGTDRWNEKYDTVACEETERGVQYMDISLRGRQDREFSSRGDADVHGIEMSDVAGSDRGTTQGNGAWTKISTSQPTLMASRSSNENSSTHSLSSSQHDEARFIAYEPTDPDVIAERDAALAYQQTVSDTPHTGTPYAIILQKLSHSYTLLGSSSHITALRELSLALRYGEVFGLLGPNGSGKSTLVGILSGLISDPSSGKIYISNVNLRQAPSEVRKLIGLCSQQDVVWDDMTVEEHLEFQCRQRGIDESKVCTEVHKAALAVGLDGDGLRTAAENLSGGMRRRLSIGMAIVGDPPIIFLDECTAGLDIESRQRVWSVIQSLRRPDRLILLTTHSMAEAEALCTRIGILASGTLQCIGTPLALRYKYSELYTLTININPRLGASNGARDSRQPTMASIVASLDAWVNAVVGNGDGQLVSTVNNTRRYTISKTSGSISRIFEVMEQAVTDEGSQWRDVIREWGVGLTSLEDVFIRAVEAAEYGVREE